MSPTSQANTNQLINQAEATGSQLQNQYNTQSAQTQQQYQDTYNQANQAYQNLQGYNNQIANTNYGQVYQQNETAQQQQLGYDPAQAKQANDLALQAVQGATTAENIMGALPQATNQMSNYSGATAGQVAGNYANMSQNINAQATNASNLLQNAQGEQGAMTGEFNAAAGAANQQVTQQLAGQTLASQNYQALYSNATQEMQTAGQTMTQIEQLQQQQGYVTAQQVAAYQNAYNGYISAQASAEQASAAMVQAKASANLANQQAAYQQMQNSTLQQAMNQINSQYGTIGATIAGQYDPYYSSKLGADVQGNNISSILQLLEKGGAT